MMPLKSSLDKTVSWLSLPIISADVSRQRS